MASENWKVTWESPAKQETRYFQERMAAIRYAERMERQTYRTRPVVSYVGSLKLILGTFTYGAL